MSGLLALSLCAWFLAPSPCPAAGLQVEDIVNYLNSPAQVTNLDIVVTNYRPIYVFRSQHAYEQAKNMLHFKLDFSPKTFHCIFSYDSELPGLLYKEVSSADFKARNFTNRDRLFLGRLGQIWWTAGKRGFVVLSNSVDGTVVDKDGTNAAYKGLVENALTFEDLGFLGLRRGTFRVRPEKRQHAFRWLADLSGEHRTGTLILKKDSFTVRGKNGPQVGVDWNTGRNRPKTVYVLDSQGKHVIRSYTLAGTVKAWLEYPRAFNYLYHTNGVDVINLLGNHGESVMIGGQRVMPEVMTEIMYKNVVILLMVGFSLGVIPLFLA